MDKKSPLVSILVAAYNAEKYIVEALDSALAQTYPNIEIVVVDDGSKDRTAEIVKEYRDPRIRYFYQENQGVVGVRNSLLREAKGEFLTYLDNDDIYLPAKVEEEVAFLNEHPEYMAVYCNMLYFYDGTPGIFYHHTFTHYSGDVFAPLLERNFITQTAYMMRRSVNDIVKGFDPKLGIAEDWAYFLKMTRYGMKIGFLEKDLVHYRVRMDSSSRFDIQPRVQESVLAIFNYLNDGMSDAERAQYHMADRIRKKKIRVAVAHLSMGHVKEFRAAWRSVRQDIGWRLLSLPLFAAAAVLPASFFRFMIEQARNRGRRNLLVPVMS